MFTLHYHQGTMIRFGSILFTLFLRCARIGLALSCAALLLTIQSTSQTILGASSATADVNSIVPIVITGTVTTTDSPMILVLEFDRTLLEPKSVEAGSIMTDGSMTIQFTPIVGTRRGRLEIVSQTVSAGDNAPLCTLRFLTLSGDSLIAAITPLSLIQNGVPLSVTPQTGTITINGNTLKKLGATTLGLPTPHPVTTSCRIPYTLGEDTPVIFSLFTIYGKLVEEYPEVQGKIGPNFFDFSPEINLIGSSPYVLRMITRSSTNNTLLLINKQ
jgi:hypothetical protein